MVDGMQKAKAVQGHRTPRRFRVHHRLDNYRQVLECDRPSIVRAGTGEGSRQILSAKGNHWGNHDPLKSSRRFVQPGNANNLK